MSTSAPVRREHDIPIVEPYRHPADPQQLPEPDPERIAVPFIPIVQPVEEPVRVR